MAEKLKIKKRKRPLKNGAIEKQVSYIMAVPRSMRQVEDLDEIVSRLHASKLFHLVSYKRDEDPVFQILYKEEEYEVTLIPENLDLPELYTINHRFSEEDIEAMRNATAGITAAMTFQSNNIDSYHLQLKVLYEIVPDMVGLVDFSSERILSGLWATMAAKSEVPPAPSYIYCIQAVGNEQSDTVWLHTHGLNRCGSIELEILPSDKEFYTDHSNVLQTIAGNIVTREPLGEEEDMFWVSTFSNGQYLICTWVDWAEAVIPFPGDMIGGAGDRENGHNENTGVIYVYPCPDDFEKRHYVPISVFNELLRENPLMMISSEETSRMKALALERIEYFRSYFNKPEYHGLMKFGLLVDQEFQNEEGNSLEHIWFAVKKMDGKKVFCERIQDAYYIKSLNEKSDITLSLDQLTDWILSSPEGDSISPDGVYQLYQSNE